MTKYLITSCITQAFLRNSLGQTFILKAVTGSIMSSCVRLDRPLRLLTADSKHGRHM